MSDLSEKVARQDRILAELSELAIGVARDLAGRVATAESAQDAAAVASAFHKVGRAVRQTIALEMKIERDRKVVAREDSKYAAGVADMRAGRRRLRLRSAVERMVWTEIEGDEAENLVEHLDELLAEDALDEAFADTPFDDQVARLRTDLGLPPAPPGEDDAPTDEVTAAPPPGPYIEEPPSAAELRAASG